MTRGYITCYKEICDWLSGDILLVQRVMSLKRVYIYKKYIEQLYKYTKWFS